MPVVYHAKPLSMGFCLDCHRNVESHLRPLDEITNLDWEAHDLDKDQFYAYLAEKTGKPADDLKEADKNKELNARLVGARLKEMMNVNPPQDCAACHR